MSDRGLGLNHLSDQLRQLQRSLLALESSSRTLKLAPLSGRDWFDLLNRKLLPQLSEGATLIVAVVGGTNIGKSVVFNHIAGFRASASSPLASGTKHPVCLVPPTFDAETHLREMFPSFDLQRWSTDSDALQETNAHLLFWRSHDRVPANLIVLDTPDVDSDAPVNWERADAIRQSADVLVAVLTQQKYNDAAVKRFFRTAATEDKAAIVVFNQVELPDDESYWPVWLGTFCEETGLRPEYVYLAKNDRKSAEAITLPFEERQWPIASNVPQADLPETADRIADSVVESTPTELSRVLSQLRFAEIKLRTLRGSMMRLFDSMDGIPSYLREVRDRGRRYRDAAAVLASRGVIKQADWPSPPSQLLVEEMWVWWDRHHSRLLHACGSMVDGRSSPCSRFDLGSTSSVDRRISTTGMVGHRASSQTGVRTTSNRDDSRKRTTHRSAGAGFVWYVL